MFELLQYFEFLRGHAPNVCYFPKNPINFERRFETKHRNALQQNKLIGRDEYSRLMVYFYPRPIFDPVMAGQMLNFGDLLVKIEVT